MTEIRLFIKLSRMKSIYRLIALLLLCCFLAGGLASCAVFEKSSPTKPESFKHKNPLPKKYVIHTGQMNIVK
jgi:hypothetical protein